MKSNKGFSLIEMMVVLCVVAILISLATINMRFLNRAAIMTNIDVMYNACYCLQKTAMATNTTQELTIDALQHSFACADIKHQFPAMMQFGILPNVKGPPSAPLSFLSAAITFVDRKILFYPDGTISAGIIYITDVDKSMIYALSCGVSSVSVLRKYRYDGKWHLI
jgi:prepilin-type N-terminal cleavage/methylation domain-containing protein